MHVLCNTKSHKPGMFLPVGKARQGKVVNKGAAGVSTSDASASPPKLCCASFLPTKQTSARMAP